VSNLPVVFLIHPVGVGATSAMNVLSAKLWLRALIDLLPDVALAAPWLLYAEAMVDRERRLRDARVFAEGCHGVIAVGGEFNCDTRAEWDLFGQSTRPRINLTRPPMPALLTYETFAETRVPRFQEAVIEEFRRVALSGGCVSQLPVSSTQ
jgi:hypothetical protein